MKKAYRMILAPFLFLLLLAQPLNAALSSLEREAAQDAIRLCVESLAAGEYPTIQRIAVLELDNDDDGEITDLLTIALTKTSYAVMLRDDLEKVLTEHEFNIRHVDMLDASTLKKLGGFLGVDGLVIGGVQEKTADQNRAHLRLNLKLANVETGEAVWGEVGIGSAAVPQPQKISNTTIVIIAVICLMLCTIWLVAVALKPSADALENRYGAKEQRLDSDRRIRSRMVRELGTAIGSLREARNQAYDANKEKLCEILKGSEHSVDLLRIEIDSAEYGALPFFEKDEIEARHLDKMIDFDETFETFLRDIVHESSEVGRKVSAGEGETEEAVEKVNALTKRLKDKFQERKNYLSGIA